MLRPCMKIMLDNSEKRKRIQGGNIPTGCNIRRRRIYYYVLFSEQFFPQKISKPKQMWMLKGKTNGLSQYD